MVQRPTDRPYSEPCNFIAGGDELAASLANFVICDYAVASIGLNSQFSTMIEAGWSAIYVVRFGDCWLNDDGLGGATRLQSGDVVLLPRGQRHWLSLVDTPVYPADCVTLWNQPTTSTKSRQPATPSSAGNCQVLACRFRNHVGRISSLLSALPTTIHVPAIAEPPASLFKTTIALMDEEAAQRDAGARHIVAYLVQVLFMQIIRQLLSGRQPAASLPEGAFKDPVIGASLGLLDSHLDAPWTLATLADAVGVSRSTFAARFVEKMGTPPLAYLWQRRMEQAGAMLSDNDLAIKEIASRIGYKSESAFSTAFKRWCGMTPGAFRRNRPA